MAGVRSGRLPIVLDQFAALSRRQQDLRRRVVLTLAYPGLLLGIMAAIMIFFHLAINRQFHQIFRDFNTRLPHFTEMYFAFSGVVAWTMLGLTITAVLVPLAALVLPLGAWLGRAAWWVPVLGPIVRYDRYVQFSQLMALLLEEKVPLPEAFRLASIGLQGTVLSAQCRAAADAVEDGDAAGPGPGRREISRQPDGTGRVGTAEGMPGGSLPRRGRGLRGPHQFAKRSAEHARAAVGLHGHCHLRRRHGYRVDVAAVLLDFLPVGLRGAR